MSNAPRDSLPIGTVLDCYRVTRLIGSGGFNVIYRAAGRGLAIEICQFETQNACSSELSFGTSLRPPFGVGAEQHFRRRFAKICNEEVSDLGAKLGIHDFFRGSFRISLLAKEQTQRPAWPLSGDDVTGTQESPTGVYQVDPAEKALCGE